jgi:hypothetical protein
MNWKRKRQSRQRRFSSDDAAAKTLLRSDDKPRFANLGMGIKCSFDSQTQKRGHAYHGESYFGVRCRCYGNSDAGRDR